MRASPGFPEAGSRAPHAPVHEVGESWRLRYRHAFP